MKPVLQALVLAERIYETKSGSKIIAGTFSTLRMGKVIHKAVDLGDGNSRNVVQGGTDPGCPALYISITDIVTGTELRVEVSNLTKNEVLFGTNFAVNCDNRLVTVEIVAPLPPLRCYIHESGMYSFDLIWRGEILGSHRLNVEEI